jgi:hypothetical protein
VDLGEASVDELFALARSSEDEDAYTAVVEELRTRSEERTFKISSVLCDSFAAGERCLGVDVLAQLGVEPGMAASDGPYAEAAATVMLRLLEEDDDPGVLAASAFGLSHMHDERAIGPLAALLAHADAEVRYSVVHGLIGHDDDRAVAALIRLSSDVDDEVRDWATFALGAQIQRDSPEVREALAARVTDAHPETRAEAILGLALRGDTRAVEPALANAPGSDHRWPPVEEAIVRLAALTGDPRFCPHLQVQREDHSPENVLYETYQQALLRCCGDQ